MGLLSFSENILRQVQVNTNMLVDILVSSADDIIVLKKGAVASEKGIKLLEKVPVGSADDLTASEMTLILLAEAFEKWIFICQRVQLFADTGASA